MSKDRAFHRRGIKSSYLVMGFLSIFFTQLLLNLFIFGYLELQQMGGVWQSSFAIQAFFREGVAPEVVEKVQEEVKALPLAGEVRLVSSEEAKNKFLGYFSLQEEDLGLEENPFPPSLEVRARRVEELPLLAQELEEIEAFEEVFYGGENTEALLRFYRFFLTAGGFLLLALFVFSLLVVTAVIRASIQARGIEIEVWSLIGATKKFIRAPFIYQGMMEGLSGGVAAFLVSLVFFHFLLDFLNTSFPLFFWISWEELVLPLGVVSVLMGSFLGFLGALLACNSVEEESAK
ncbi:MAG TPA: permease-like cell division protein FtsX [Candidatus Atribacteria bacterium]|nr:permease-like cell division protein FtsX [Candidatus Atribacteria bacterium]HPU08816.1 permease-like cell division protein FtsX [Candidatus Atribacteria bacterium]HPZ81463.1 permease-like cell division protein FtsX [Candidatus Atribacteria bacterium]HQE25103.1 permease-like cell division protein FtsX [Candidatus Atribacteria bacterium]